MDVNVLCFLPSRSCLAIRLLGCTPIFQITQDPIIPNNVIILFKVIVIKCKDIISGSIVRCIGTKY